MGSEGACCTGWPPTHGSSWAGASLATVLHAAMPSMTRRRWIWAVGLLRVGRVLDSNVPADDLILDNLNDCLAAIDHAVKVVEARGIESLIMRMPRGTAKPPTSGR